MKNLTQEQKKSLLEKDKLLDRHIKRTTDIIKKKYLVLSKSIIKEILILIRELEGQDTPLRDYLNYKNYYRLLTAIEYKIHELGRIEQRLLEEEMVEFYIICFALEPLGGEADREKAVRAVDGVWCSDGKHWPERVWEHSGKLYNRIDSILTNGIVSNISTEVTENELKKVFDQAYNEDKNLIDTELSHIMNKADSDKYEENNI